MNESVKIRILKFYYYGRLARNKLSILHVLRNELLCLEVLKCDDELSSLIIVIHNLLSSACR